MTVPISAPTGRLIIAQGKAQRRPGLPVQNIFPALKGRPNACAATIRSFRMVQTGTRRARQLVTDCHLLETARLCASQPVTICNRLKLSLAQRKLIPSP